jgi:CubicO group peptidase (beta-lactamase class C family)
LEIVLGKGKIIFCFALLLVCACAPKDPEGAWQGYLVGEGEKFRIALTFGKDIQGKLSGNYNNIDEGIYLEPLQQVQVGQGILHSETANGGLFDLRMNWSGDGFIGTFRPGPEPSTQQSLVREGKVYRVELKRGLDFLSPRLASEGRSQFDYGYQLSRRFADGWKAGDLRDSGADVPKLELGIKKILDGTFPHIHSVVVARGDELLLDEYFYGYGPQDGHPVQSITKSVFSVLIGIALNQSLFKLDDKLFDFFPEYRGKPGWQASKDKINLGMLLTMTSGLDCDDWKDSQACSWDMVRSPDWLDFSLTRPLSHKPGGHFAYCGACLTPLSALLARKSGMGLPAFAQRNLWEPLGIQNPAWITGPHGMIPASFGLALKPRDLAKLGVLYLKKGEWNGKQVISERWVEESTSVQVPKKQAHQPFDYGYLWWQRQVPCHGKSVRVIFAWGVGGQYLFIAPELDLVCVITAGNYRDSKLSAKSFQFFQDYVLGVFSFRR